MDIFVEDMLNPYARTLHSNVFWTEKVKIIFKLHFASLSASLRKSFGNLTKFGRRSPS
jgi:hypothetical protein